MCGCGVRIHSLLAVAVDENARARRYKKAHCFDLTPQIHNTQHNYYSATVVYLCTSTRYTGCFSFFLDLTEEMKKSGPGV